MSRLQVGGLALAINTQYPENEMTTVKLLGFVGEAVTSLHGYRCDYWEIENIRGGRCFGSRKNGIAHPAKYLIPLGDKKTQDEFTKEKEIENV
jgi:hypothetical protein